MSLFRDCELAQWATSDALGGFVSASLNLVENTEHGRLERSVVANADIKSGEVVLRLPLSCCLSGKADYARTQSYDIRSVIPAKLLKTGTLSNEEEHVAVAETYRRILQLLHCHSGTADAGMKAYVALLPKLEDFNHMPVQWTEEQLELCGANSMVKSIVMRLKVEMQEAFKVLQPLVAQIFAEDAKVQTLFTYQFVEWAYMCMNSRSFSARPRNTPATATELKFLVPLADMLNHADANSNQCNVYPSLVTDTKVAEDADEEGGEALPKEEYWEVVATKDITEGEELFFEYRKGDNTHFVVYYGFAVPESPNAAVFLQVEVQDAKKAVNPLLMRALETLDLPATPTMAIPLTYPTPLPMGLIWALRVAKMNNAQLKAFLAGQVKLTLDQEVLCWREINAMLRAGLGSYLKDSMKIKKIKRALVEEPDSVAKSIKKWQLSVADILNDSGMTLFKNGLVQCKAMDRETQEK